MLPQKSKVFTTLITSVLFTLILLLIRIMLTYKLTYIFYAWNLFLAIIPLYVSNKLSNYKTFAIQPILLLCVWLLFFPNAPYIVTDLFHFTKREPIPLWYDLLIVITATWNGLMLGFVSLLQVEKYLSKFLTAKKLQLIMYGCFLLCGFGVYMGRYLRFNSWDVVYNIDDLAYQIAHRFIFPWQHTITWGFSMLFAIMLAVFYYTIKSVAKLYSEKTLQ